MNEDMNKNPAMKIKWMNVKKVWKCVYIVE